MCLAPWSVVARQWQCAVLTNPAKNSFPVSFRFVMRTEMQLRLIFDLHLTKCSPTKGRVLCTVLTRTYSFRSIPLPSQPHLNVLFPCSFPRCISAHASVNKSISCFVYAFPLMVLDTVYDYSNQCLVRQVQLWTKLPRGPVRGKVNTFLWCSVPWPGPPSRDLFIIEHSFSHTQIDYIILRAILYLQASVSPVCSLIHSVRWGCRIVPLVGILSSASSKPMSGLPRLRRYKMTWAEGRPFGSASGWLSTNNKEPPECGVKGFARKSCWRREDGDGPKIWVATRLANGYWLLDLTPLPPSSFCVCVLLRVGMVR